MPSIYVTEAELEAIRFCAAQVSDAIERGADQEYCDEAEKHLNCVHSIEQKFGRSQSNQQLTKALKAQFGQ